jgi:HEXXH motif-containing protein
LITHHLLPEAAFAALAEGGGDRAAIQLLHDAQLSKHLMLLQAVAGACAGTDRGPAAFRAGFDLLARIQATDPGAGAWLLGLPHLGGWAHDCLIRLDQGSPADFGHFACLAAAAAIRAGVPFELDVPVRDARIRLPGLGSLLVAAPSAWAGLRCDGERVTAGDHFAADRRLLAPDDGSAGAPGEWSGTPAIRAVADGLAWNVLLETADPYLDRYPLPMSAGLSPADLRRWRDRLRSAWDVLVRYHRWAAEPMASGISVVVPLTPHSDTDLVSATTPAAFGAIATSWPPDQVTLAETLVHEFQHVKLGALLDLVPLLEPGGEKVYAPWRPDPRPAGGLLQGVYAHLGIVRFWLAQQHAETGPDDVLRAQASLARWAAAIEPAVRTLQQSGCLTQAGLRFVRSLGARARDEVAGEVPGQARQVAGEAAKDHWLTWQIRHVATDAAEVAALADVYRRGERFPAGTQPMTRIQEDTRKAGPALRTRLLNLRYLAAARYSEVLADEVFPLSDPDRLLLARRSGDAVRAYRTLIADCADPQPDAWIGLALALHQLPASSLQATFATRLALLFDVHACLGGRVDPLDLAGWFT